MNDETLLYTVKEAAVLLGVDVHIVYNLIKTGILPALKIGSFKIRRQSLEDFAAHYEGFDLTDPTHPIALDLANIG